MREAALVAIVVVAAGSIARPAEPTRGQALFQANCGACHNDRPDALGPRLAGVVGRAAGSAPGFRYSGPMRRSGLTWSRQTLTDFVISPQAVVKGTRMPFEGLASQADAAAIADYIATLQGPSAP